MGPKEIWDFIYKQQQIQNKRGNYLIDDYYHCRYTKCNNKEVIKIYNKDEWETEWICKECFVDDWGKTDYCIVLPTIYDEKDYVPTSIFIKYGDNNEC